MAAPEPTAGELAELFGNEVPQTEPEPRLEGPMLLKNQEATPAELREIFGQTGQAKPTPETSVEETEEYWDPKYYTDKAKLGMASLLSLGGLPVDFIHGLQYAALDMFDDLDQSFNDMIGRERTINGKPQPPEAFKTIRPTLPYGFDKQVEAYEQILFGDFDFAEREKDMSFGKKTLGTAAEFGGGAVIPGSAIVNKTAGLVPKMVVAGTEVASVAIGALGAEGGGEIGSELDKAFGTIDSQFFETGGRLTGTLAGSLSPYAFPSIMRPAVTKIRGYLNKDFQEKAGRAAAAKLIKKELADIPDTIDELRRSLELQENIPGFSPTLGMETGNPGIMALQKRFAMKNTEGLGRAIEAERRSLSAIRNRMNEVFPPSEQPLTTLPGKRLERISDSFLDDINRIDGEIRKIESTITKGSPKSIGQRLRMLRKEKEEAARAVKNLKYEEFYQVADDANITVDPESIRTIARETLNDPGLTFQKKAPVLKDIEKRYLKKTPDTDVTPFVDARGNPLPVPEGDISMREYHSMMKRVNKEKNIAYKGMMQGDNDAAAQYFQLKKMDNLFAKNWDALKEGPFGIVADKLKAADDFYKTKYQKVFREGIGGEFDAMTRYGQKTADSKIFEKIVLRDERGPQQFRELYGESLEAQQLMDNGLMDVFARRVMKSGTYDEGAAAKFFDQYDVVLDEMPELQAALKNRDTAIKVLTDRKAVVRERVNGIHRSRLEAMTGLNNTEEVVELAVKDPERMRTLRRTAQDSGLPDAMVTLRHNVADHVLKQKDPFEYFMANEAQMKIAYKDSEHFKTIKDLAEAKRIVSRQLKTEGTGTDLLAKDPLQELTGTSTTAAASRLRWLASGFLNKWHIIGEATSRFVLRAKTREMERMMEAALYDKGVGKKLLEYIDDTGTLKPEATVPFRPPETKGKLPAGATDVSQEAAQAAPSAFRARSEKEWAKVFKDIMFQLGIRSTIDATSQAELAED